MREAGLIGRERVERLIGMGKGGTELENGRRERRGLYIFSVGSRRSGEK